MFTTICVVFAVVCGAKAVHTASRPVLAERARSSPTLLKVDEDIRFEEDVTND